MTSEKRVSNTCDTATLGPWNLDSPPGLATNELLTLGNLLSFSMIQVLICKMGTVIVLTCKLGLED